MQLLTISNLYSRPDQPQRGLFNVQLFAAMAEQIKSRRSGAGSQDSVLINICLVPEWRVWRWARIKEWGEQYSVNSEQYPRLGSRSTELNIRTIYLPVFYIPIVGRSLNWRIYLQALRKLKIQVLKCDVVFSTWLYPDGVAATMVADSCGRRSWMMVQGSDSFHLEHASRRKVILNACNKAEGVVCVCKSLADRLIAAGIDAAKVHVVPNGVNGELFRYRTREEAAKQLSVNGSWLLSNKERITNSQYRIVLFVGNLVPVKGPDILLEAWNILQKSKKKESKPQIDADEYKLFPFESGFGAQDSITPLFQCSSNLVLLFIGDGPMRKDLERQVHSLGMDDSIFFLGSRPHEEVALWMNLADCLCLPSRNEGLPNVVIEALASGLPIMATDVGGVGELLENEITSRIVPVLESSAEMLVSQLAALISNVLCGTVDRKAMAERNKGRFSWSKQAETILNLVTS